MSKKTMIVIRLVPESKGERKEVIRNQIMKEDFIPFFAQIEKVEIEPPSEEMV